MNKLVKFYKRYKKRLGDTVEVFYTDKTKTDITHIYWKNEGICYCIIGPHNGNGYQYILRVNPEKTLDRWINADLQYYYRNIEGIINALFKRGTSWIYKELLDTYIDAYLEDHEY